MPDYRDHRKTIAGKGFVFAQLPGGRSLLIRASSLTLEETNSYTQIRGDDNRFPGGIVLGEGTAKVILEHGEIIQDEDWMEILGFVSQYSTTATHGIIKNYKATVTDGEIDLSSQIPAGHALSEYAIVVHYADDNVSLRKESAPSQAGEFAVNGDILEFHVDDEGADVVVNAVLTTGAWQYLKDGAFTGRCQSLWLVFPTKHMTCNASVSTGDYLIIEVFEAELIPDFSVIGSNDPFVEKLTWEVLRRASDGMLYAITEFAHDYIAPGS